MATEYPSPLGACPCCQTTIPAGNELIEYERSDGGVAVYADCPECRIPVHPQ